MIDPTYDPSEIDANPTWRLAFEMSEWFNDEAPIGWSRFIPQAEWILRGARGAGVSAGAGVDLPRLAVALAAAAVDMNQQVAEALERARPGVLAAAAELERQQRDALDRLNRAYAVTADAEGGRA